VVLELPVAVLAGEAVLAGVLEVPVVAGPAVEQVVLVAAADLELAQEEPGVAAVPGFAREGLEVAVAPGVLVAEVVAVGSLPLLPLA